MDVARHYEERDPGAELRAWVECFWWDEVRGPAARSHSHRVLPDGCVDVLFDLTEKPWGSVVGAMTRALVVAGTGPRRFLAVRFRPGGARAFFRSPLDEWTDLRVDLEEAWPGEGGLAGRLAAAAFPHGAVSVLREHLLARLRPTEPALDRALHWLWQQPALSVRAAADALGMTRQHLTRRCKAATGLGPKQLQRVARLRRALALAGEGPRAWARIALDAGYCDQAHLIGDCRALTGLTPVALLA